MWNFNRATPQHLYFRFVHGFFFCSCWRGFWLFYAVYTFAPAIFTRTPFIYDFVFCDYFILCAFTPAIFTPALCSCVSVCGRARLLLTGYTCALYPYHWCSVMIYMLYTEKRVFLINLRDWSCGLRCPGRRINSLIIALNVIIMFINFTHVLSILLFFLLLDINTNTSMQVHLKIIYIQYIPSTL